MRGEHSGHQVCQHAVRHGIERERQRYGRFQAVAAKQAVGLDRARLVDSPTLVSGDYEKFVPGVGRGEPIASRLNPVLYDRPGRP